MTLFPLTTLIRLYELLKNSRLTLDDSSLNNKAVSARNRFGVELVVVEDDGIEPTTPCLQSRCSPS
jgi:hypothetical protein